MSGINTAIVLAGGLGTRLRHLVSDLPKPMAPVAGKPFLEFVLTYLVRQGFKNAILSVGYKHESINMHFGASFGNLQLEYVVEAFPLGTGGGIKKCLQHCPGDEDVLIVNGDTYFPVDIAEMYKLHLHKHANLTIALKELTNCDRYGTVELNKYQQIISFRDKSLRINSLINGGLYICNTQLIKLLPEQEVFSFETDFLNQSTPEKQIFGYVDKGYFIDIGVPDDYHRAQTELAIY